MVTLARDLACAQCGDAHPAGTALCPRTGLRVDDGPCGKRVDRYDVEAFIASGGMGTVYRARHAILGQQVALKLLKLQFADSPEILERFQREARAAASIGSPHIIRVTDVGVAEGGQAFLVMELLEGRDLRSLLREHGRLPLGRALDIGLQILDGLGAAHAANIVHRDLKPANVFLTRATDATGAPRDFVKLLDFGISKMDVAERPALTSTGMVMGTPQYMAPEQLMDTRAVDARADIYSAAVTLYQMLAGTLPFAAQSYERMVVQVCTEAPEPLRRVAPDVPEAVAAVIERAMAREPERRPASARELALALCEAAPRDTASFAAIALAGQAAVASGHALPAAELPTQSSPSRRGIPQTSEVPRPATTVGELRRVATRTPSPAATATPPGVYVPSGVAPASGPVTRSAVGRGPVDALPLTSQQSARLVTRSAPRPDARSVETHQSQPHGGPTLAVLAVAFAFVALCAAAITAAYVFTRHGRASTVAVASGPAAPAVVKPPPSAPPSAPRAAGAPERIAPAPVTVAVEPSGAPTTATNRPPTRARNQRPAGERQRPRTVDPSGRDISGAEAMAIPSSTAEPAHDGLRPRVFYGGGQTEGIAGGVVGAAVRAEGGWASCWPRAAPAPDVTSYSFALDIGSDGHVRSVVSSATNGEPAAFSSCVAARLRRLSVAPPGQEAHARVDFTVASR